MAVTLLAVLSGPIASTARADVADYVKQPDTAFAWKLTGKRTIPLVGRTYDLELTSQVWQGITWKHDLLVVVPDKVEPKATLFLWNTGGKPSPAGLALAADLARKMRAPVAFLYGIPNQPLFGGKTEDALIAETFVRYLATGDASWPLLFPMVKSVVRAMDALQAFARQEWKTEVKQFIVSGASKRGWTTWLTAASDPRVKAIAPLVIDTLNMQKQLPHQLASYGAYSQMIHDYTERKLAPPPQTPAGQKLWAMVDPWVYRDRLTLPKLILNGTNDPYWTQDALNLYWDDLSGEKWVCYIPNAGHNLQQRKADGKNDLTRASSTLAAFARSQIHGVPFPQLSWKNRRTDEAVRLTVHSSLPPVAARLWTAEAATRDFRKAKWTATPIEVGKGDLNVEVKAPADGYRVCLVECEYDMEGLHYFLSTQVRILAAPGQK
ncbi:MAG: PhoPQ-activated protein PqaA family protein [Gemmataceae bacterium]